MNATEYIVGIDEAGRGPLAGPVAVGIVAVPTSFNVKKIDGITDSKQLTQTRREEWHKTLTELHANSEILTGAFYSRADYIDEYGIVPAIEEAVASGLRKLDIPQNRAHILLDGSLSAPEGYADQETITRGDEKEPLISAASVMAKVNRDRQMKEYAKKFPDYGFESHKGYPTKGHYKAIEAHGVCEIHRRSFLTKILD